MNTPFVIRIVTFVIAFTLTGLATHSAADPTPTLTLVLQVPDDGDVPVHIVALAKPEVERIYREAGVTVIWSDAAERDQDPVNPQSSLASNRGFGLVVLSRRMTDRLTVATDALGGAAGVPGERRRMAYVFYHRVERIARTHMSTSSWREASGVDVAILLAHAMAHEIGHLLIPDGHSATGLMRADWSTDDLRDAARGELNFTPEQAEVIRARLPSDPAGSESPVHPLDGGSRRGGE